MLMLLLIAFDTIVIIHSFIHMMSCLFLLLRGIIRQLLLLHSNSKAPSVNNNEFRQSSSFGGSIHLMLGVTHPQAILYESEWDSLKQQTIESNRPYFNVDYAFSKVEEFYACQQQQEGNQPQLQSIRNQYVQDLLKQHLPIIVNKMNRGGHIYFCGLRGMMRDVHNMFKAYFEQNFSGEQQQQQQQQSQFSGEHATTTDAILVGNSLRSSATSSGSLWDKICAQWRDEKRWHVELY